MLNSFEAALQQKRAAEAARRARARSARGYSHMIDHRNADAKRRSR